MMEPPHPAFGPPPPPPREPRNWWKGVVASFRHKRNYSSGGLPAFPDALSLAALGFYEVPGPADGAAVDAYQNLQTNGALDSGGNGSSSSASNIDGHVAGGKDGDLLTADQDTTGTPHKAAATTSSTIATAADSNQQAAAANSDSSGSCGDADAPPRRRLARGGKREQRRLAGAQRWDGIKGVDNVPLQAPAPAAATGGAGEPAAGGGLAWWTAGDQ